jgi:hypothetical protein
MSVAWTDMAAYTTAFSLALLYNMAAAGATSCSFALLLRKPARPV